MSVFNNSKPITYYVSDNYKHNIITTTIVTAVVGLALYTMVDNKEHSIIVKPENIRDFFRLWCVGHIICRAVRVK